ncbi:glutamate synthase domain protein [Trypanosoma grayi]|uniref:glutamate synthase domain protein n=1 Tax=Trypanosoma grayi TaxID=71804 RepID=UPI0004F427CA|nr:glutamate synthase domain protein [Trypanosoma grayi]KEG05674.1 glutamate synthase domain protein [Trypanosoma grayi]
MPDTAAYAIKTHVAVPQKAPYGVDVVAGKEYYWCTCGLSKNQPFCDGAHQAYNEEHKTQLKPMAFTAAKTEKAYLCGCKQTPAIQRGAQDPAEAHGVYCCQDREGLPLRLQADKETTVLRWCTHQHLMT